MVDLRAMHAGDVARCAELTHEAFDEMRRRFCLPVSGWTEAVADRYITRFRGFLDSDPGGSVVAVTADRIVGFAQAIVREALWMLSMIAVDPDHQEGRVGSRLLAATLDYGDGAGPGLILCSRDPRAARAYARAGFALHPAVAAWGHVDASGLPTVSGLRRGTVEDKEIVAAVDRRVRGASRAEDVGRLMDHGDAELWLADDDGWVLVSNDRPYALAARHEDTARALLSHALGRIPPDRTCEVGWLTAGQAWAIDVALTARLELHPVGPYFTRGLPGPFTPALACGAFG